MTQSPSTPGLDNYGNAAPKEGNTLGLVGFILSIVQFVTCGVLSPISLIVSLIGLRKEPRVFAIIGTVLSVIGVVIFALIGFTTVWALMFGQGIVQQAFGGAQAQQEIIAHYQNTGSLPTDAQAAQIFANIDFGGVTPRYVIVDDTAAEIILPGFDGQMDTSDDLPFPIDVGSSTAPPATATPPATTTP